MKFIKIKKDSFSLISAILFLILGVILISNPDWVVKFITYILGAIIIILGGIKLFTYFKNKKQAIEDYNNLVLGITFIVLGIVIMFCSSIIAFVIRLFMGGWLLFNGVTKLMLSLQLRTLNIETWYIPLITSIIMIICGLYTIIVTNIIGVAGGIILVIYSISEIIQYITVPKNKNPDIIK